MTPYWSVTTFQIDLRQLLSLTGAVTTMGVTTKCEVTTILPMAVMHSPELLTYNNGCQQKVRVRKHLRERSRACTRVNLQENGPNKNRTWRRQPCLGGSN